MLLRQSAALDGLENLGDGHDASKHIPVALLRTFVSLRQLHYAWLQQRGVHGAGEKWPPFSEDAGAKATCHDANEGRLFCRWCCMTGVRVDRPTDEWERVPRRMPDDWRLSLDTRAVAVWIATRTDSFSLTVGGIRTCLHIGKDGWRRMRDELILYGYLEVDVAHGIGGKFESGLVFHVVPVGGFPDPTDRKKKPLQPLQPLSAKSSPANPIKKPKKAEKTAAQPTTAEPSPVEPTPAEAASTRDLISGEISLSIEDIKSRAKEVRDLSIARAIGSAGNLLKDEIDAVLAVTQYPSKAPEAMRQAVAARLRVLKQQACAEKERETANNAAARHAANSDLIGKFVIFPDGSRAKIGTIGYLSAGGCRTIEQIRRDLAAGAHRLVDGPA